MGLLFDALGMGGDRHCSSFVENFSEWEAADIPSQLNKKQPCALVIWGGEDICPSYYDQPADFSHKKQPSTRDIAEARLAREAILLGIPIIGVCRGAQLMCAIGGGKLIQDVQAHHSDHTITTEDGTELITTSIHHQMMFPWTQTHKMFAWSSHSRSPYYRGYGNPEDDTYDVKFPKTAFFNDPVTGELDVMEPEIVWFPKTKCLAIQGHPEYFNNNHAPFVKYCNHLIRDLFK